MPCDLPRGGRHDGACIARLGASMARAAPKLVSCHACSVAVGVVCSRIGDFGPLPGFERYMRRSQGQLTSFRVGQGAHSYVKAGGEHIFYGPGNRMEFWTFRRDGSFRGVYGRPTPPQRPFSGIPGGINQRLLTLESRSVNSGHERDCECERDPPMLPRFGQPLARPLSALGAF